MGKELNIISQVRPLVLKLILFKQLHRKSTQRKPSGTLQNPEKEQVCGTVSKPTPKLPQKYFQSILKFIKNQENNKQSEKCTRRRQAWGARPTPQGVPTRLVAPSWTFPTPFFFHITCFARKKFIIYTHGCFDHHIASFPSILVSGCFSDRSRSPWLLEGSAPSTRLCNLRPGNILSAKSIKSGCPERRTPR